MRSENFQEMSPDQICKFI